MAQRSKADRQAAAKKGAATRQRNAAAKSGGDAKRAGESSANTAVSAVKSFGDMVQQAGKSLASRIGAARKGR